jgi:hypothetical protein
VTAAQVEELGLPTAPAKEGDKRAFTGETCQAEAIPPDTLREILIDAVEERIDFGVRNELLEREAKAKAGLEKKLRKL